MTLVAHNVARRFLHARALDLSAYGLEGLTKGTPVTLYHGTTRSFKTFRLDKSRTELVQNYYGSGIFLTPSKRVAVDYAEANRNIGFDPSIIDDLRRRNPRAGWFMKVLYKEGDDGWDTLLKALEKAYPEEPHPMTLADEYLGVDPNTVGDVCGYILGSKVVPLGSGGPTMIFNMSTGAPSHIYDSLDELGIDSSVYRPKVYTVSVTVHNPLVTANTSQARSAKRQGYDSVIFYGSDLVSGVPEVAVFDPSSVRIKSVEVL